MKTKLFAVSKKNNAIKYFTVTLVCALAISTLQSCLDGCKKRGCTNSTATNYDPNSDGKGVCIYTGGEVVFWSPITNSVDRIDVTIGATGAAGTTGSITTERTAAPVCGTSGCFSTSLNAGTYGYTAVGIGGGTWSGNVTIIGGDCAKVKIE